MASTKFGKAEILATFYDEGVYTTLYSEGAVTAAFGSAAGQPTYAICQDGSAVAVKDADKTVKVLEMAAKTGNPVVTFYNSVGAKLEEGLDTLTASANVTAAIAKLSGVVPQVAVVTGVCAGTAAMQAAAADVCLMAKDAELFLTAPFTSAAAGDKVEGAGSAEYAAKAGVVTAVYETVQEAVKAAADAVALLPSNNLSSPAVFDFEAPAAALDMKKYCRIRAGVALIDKDRDFEFYADYGKNAYTALGTVNGSTVGVVTTSDRELDHESVSKIARFVRLCDAFSVPVVTLVNSEGFAKSCTEDLAGGIREAARLAGTYADATTAKVAILAGKAVGPVYTALCNAAKSGVDVRIITPHIPDKRYVFEVTRAHYPPLLEAGVQIYEYTPGFIHAKNFVVDDRFATVGTVNLDYRSLFLHFEDGVWLCEAPCIRDIRSDFEETLKVSEPVSLRQFKHLNVILQLYRSILRVFAPLM